MPRSTLVAGDDVAGRFRIIRPLGSGGFGAVYEAERADGGGRVALKVLRTTVAADEIERKRFAREAWVLTELRHPHVVRVVETGETGDGAPYLALELLRGHSLRDDLAEVGARPAGWVAQLGRQVLTALATAHRSGTVHRDLKPHNLFLCADQPAEPYVKVLDFGIAKLVGAGAKAYTRLTETGSVLGTPPYMAPEQILGEEIGPGVDLYALGLIMAEALAGRRIVQGSDALRILLIQASGAPHILPDEVVRSPLGAVIARAVQKRPGERYGSAEAMRADFETI